LPFAVVPLIMFTSRKDVMGVLTNSRLTTAVLTLVAGLIVLLNIYLLVQTFAGG
jgi:manganese transport protein